MNRAASPKPQRGSARREKARGKRQEAKVAAAVRADCVVRDGYCLIASRLPRSVAGLLGPCEGLSEWAHVGEHRRCFTRGQEPEQRHTTAGSGQMCTAHHVAYDSHEFDFETYTEAGMDGVFAVIQRAA